VEREVREEIEEAIDFLLSREEVNSRIQALARVLSQSPSAAPDDLIILSRAEQEVLPPLVIQRLQADEAWMARNGYGSSWWEVEGHRRPWQPGGRPWDSDEPTPTLDSVIVNLRQSLSLRRAAAENRARGWLKELLPDQAHRYERNSYIEVASPGHPGRVYRIHHGHGPFLTHIYEKGRLIGKCCLAFKDPELPSTDRVLAECFLIRGDEARYLRTANVQWLDQGSPRRRLLRAWIILRCLVIGALIFGLLNYFLDFSIPWR